MGERRFAVRLTDDEKKLVDLARTSDPLPPPISHALLRLVEHARNGGALLRDNAASAEASPAPAFKHGDVVQLKSGGHAMMVTLADCCCAEVIYSHNGELKTCDLSMSCLQIYDPADDPSRPDIPF